MASFSPFFFCGKKICECCFRKIKRATIDDSNVVPNMTEEKKPGFSQYNIEGKALEAF